MIKSFEGARGFAALLVALFHLADGRLEFSLIENGYLFVDLFFVLSGFVICASYGNRLQRPADFFPFMLRRFGRLFPLMVATTVVFVLLPLAIKHGVVLFGFGGFLKNPPQLSLNDLPALSHVAGALTLTQGMGVFDSLTLNYVSWSISTEFYTYALFAVLCFFFRGRTRLVVFAAVAIIAFVITYRATVDVHHCLFMGECMDVTYDFGFARCVASFLLGALMFYASKAWTWHPGHLQFSALVMLTAVFAAIPEFPGAALGIPFVFAVLILSLSKDTGHLAIALQSAPFQLLGQRSYSIYMLHPVLVILLAPFSARYGSVAVQAVITVFYVVALVVISGWTYRFIEHPFRTMFNRIADRFAAGASTSETVAAIGWRR